MPITQIDPLTGERRPYQSPEGGTALAHEAQFQGPPPVEFWEQVGAAFQLDNTVGSVINFLGRDEFEDDPDFDYRDHLRPGERGQEFTDARSLAEFQDIRRRLERERGLRQSLAQGPVNSFLLSTVASVFDPINLVPVGGSALAGGRIGTRIARGALAGTGGAAVAEGALQATQMELPWEESVASVLLSGVLGSAIGAAGGVLARASGGRPIEPIFSQGGTAEEIYTQAVDDFGLAMRDVDPLNASTAPQSVSAASALPDPDDTRLAGSLGVAELNDKVFRRRGLMAPGAELSGSPSAFARRTVQSLVDIGVYTRGQMRGLASEIPVETHIRARTNQGNLAVSRELRSQWATYRKRVPKGQRLTETQFNEAVGRELRGRKSGIQEVEAAATRLRNEILNPSFREAQAARLLPDDITPSPNYLTRVYNIDAIQRNPGEFKRRIENYLRRIIPADEVVDDAEYGVMADDIIEQIFGSPASRTPIPRARSKAGAFKERTLDIPDHEIEEFLEHNAGAILQRYLQTTIPDLELAQRFGVRQTDSGGSVDPTDSLVRGLRDDFNQLIERAVTEAERLKLAQRRDREAELLRALVARVRGTDGAPANPSYRGLRTVARAAKDMSFATLLGSVVLSSIPDLGRIVMTNGLYRSGRVTLGNFANGFKSYKLGQQEARAAGTALEAQLATMQRAVFDLQSAQQQRSAIERVTGASARGVSQLSLLGQWTDMMKSMTAGVVQDRVLRTVTNLSKASQMDRAKLARAGIDEDMARRMATQFREFGTTSGGAHFANSADWTDLPAKTAFQRAILRDVDDTIITPGAGDSPIWTTTEWGKVIFQFKRHAMASTQRVLISGLQARDMATLNGVLVMGALGMMVTALKDLTIHGEVRERSIEQWIVEAVDRSGIISLYMELDSLVAKTGAPTPITAFTGESPSRFASRNLIGQLAGPAIGTLEDVARSAGNLLSGENFSASDLHQIRRLIPGQNLFYLGWLFDQLEDSVDLPDNRRDQ